MADVEGRITYFNRAAEALFGYTTSDVLGQPLTLLMPARFREGHVQGFNRYRATGEAHVIGKTVELAGVRKNGTEFPLELSLATGADGTQRFFAAIIRDLTARKRAEQAVREAEARERELERLKELNGFKTQFINTAAHELLTPLTPLRSILYTLRTDVRHKDDETLQHQLEVLSRNLERLARLTSDLLESSRLEAKKLGLRRQRIDLSEIGREAVEAFQEVARRSKIHLESAFAPGLVVDADPDRIAQVYHNLLSNALKFTPGGGRVRVETRRSDDGALIRISDNGRGIPPELLPKLFQPFSRAPDASSDVQPGTGLGLFITKGIVELHGGEIGVESAGPGRGATFTVLLQA
jgi:PAS domain S-box-containing protein